MPIVSFGPIALHVPHSTQLRGLKASLLSATCLTVWSSAFFLWSLPAASRFCRKRSRKEEKLPPGVARVKQFAGHEGTQGFVSEREASSSFTRICEYPPSSAYVTAPVPWRFLILETSSGFVFTS